MNKLKYFAILFAPLLINASSFVSVMCIAQNGAPVTYTSTDTRSSCSGLGTVASGEVIFTPSVSPTGFNTLSTTEDISASQSSMTGSSGASSLTISYSNSITTTGIERSGFMEIEGYSEGNNPYDGHIGMSLGFQIDGYQTMLSCDPRNGCTPGQGYFKFVGLIPLELGVEIPLIATGSASTAAVGSNGFSGGTLSTFYSFRFLEADGVTPVAIASTVPEPNTIFTALFALAFILTYFVRKTPVACSTAHSTR